MPQVGRGRNASTWTFSCVQLPNRASAGPRDVGGAPSGIFLRGQISQSVRASEKESTGYGKVMVKPENVGREWAGSGEGLSQLSGTAEEMGDSFTSRVYTPRIQTFVPPIRMDVSVEVREQQRLHWPAGDPPAHLSKRIKNLRPVSALTPRAAPLIVPSWTKEEMMQVDHDPEGQYDLPPGSARSWGGPERDPAMAATRPHAVGWVAAPSQSWGPVRQRTPRTPLQRTPQASEPLPNPAISGLASCAHALLRTN